MLPGSELTSPPGFFVFRWHLDSPVESARDIAVAFKVPGALATGTLVELVENVCRGPSVPDAVVLLQIAEDSVALENELRATAVRDTLVRFQDRLPLLVIKTAIGGLSSKAISIRPSKGSVGKALKTHFVNNMKALIRAGLSSVFHKAILIEAPQGYEFLKPSGNTSPQFIKAEAAFTSSGAVAFCALALWQKILANIGGPPEKIEQLMLDTMAISPVAFALRELFAMAKMPRQPVIESFHSYGGMEMVPQLLRGSTLCLISASSSMEMHREWVRTKLVPPTEVITLVSFEDCRDSDAALYCLPKKWRSSQSAATAKHHIRITGENFIAESEAPVHILLRKKFHRWPEGVKLIQESVTNEPKLFDIYRSTQYGNLSRRGLFVDADVLINSNEFMQKYVYSRLRQSAKAATRYVAYQDNGASKILAEKCASFCRKTLGLRGIKLVSFEEINKNPTVVERDAGIILVSAVVGAGSALLGVSRNLRGVHRGPRLYLVGIQVAEKESQLKTFEANLTASAHNASIEFHRHGKFAINSSLLASFDDEMKLYISAAAGGLPELLKNRFELLKKGGSGRFGGALLPQGLDGKDSLVLRKDFVFWDDEYSEGAHQPAVLATIAVLLQHARESSDIPPEHRLFAFRPTQIMLHPENFARFDDGVIQAAILRTALPSELDYRCDHDASAYMRTYLIRCANHLGTSRAEGALEFLCAIATGRLKLRKCDQIDVIHAYKGTAAKMKNPFFKAINWFALQITDGPAAATSSAI